MEAASQLLKTAGALALVLGILFAFIYILRRWGGLAQRSASQSLIEILSKQSFGPRHHLILVKVTGERNVLVGVSPQNMSLLSLTTPDMSGKDGSDVIENI
jgi:flagellar protein FliO/FliZ